ncbi:MAG: hypothetical protein M1814_000057 [Vezdaea aestivalis]|nr:MAG: hypothetical protein M1814_000057 [Vezdaea aestivalis]
MARSNTDNQFRFLISCIRNATNGRPDFDKVSKECNIVSKPAAAKRYERMMKAHGISATGVQSVTEKNPATDEKPTPKPKPASRGKSATDEQRATRAAKTDERQSKPKKRGASQGGRPSKRAHLELDDGNAVDECSDASSVTGMKLKRRSYRPFNMKGDMQDSDNVKLECDDIKDEDEDQGIPMGVSGVRPARVEDSDSDDDQSEHGSIKTENLSELLCDAVQRDCAADSDD